MKWTKRDDMIVDADTGDLVCLIPPNADELTVKILEISPDILASVVKFVSDVERGTFKPKKTYDNLKELLDKIPPYLYDLQRLTIETAG